MTPQTFAGSAIVLAGLIGFCLFFKAPFLGLALFCLAGAGVYVIVNKKDQ